MTPGGSPLKGLAQTSWCYRCQPAQGGARTTAPGPPLPLLAVSTEGASKPEAVGIHVEVEATHPRQIGCCIQLGTRNTVTSTELSAHHMSGSARDHLIAKDKPFYQGHKVALCDAVGACVLLGQGSRPSRAAQATVDNGATVGFEWAVGVGAVNGNKEAAPGSGQVHTCLPRRVAGRAGHVSAEQAGQLESCKVWTTARQAPQTPTWA